MRTKLVLLVWAALATVWVGYFSVALEKRYLDHHPYFFDAVSYSFYNAKLHQRIMEVGRGQVILEELDNNNRHPLRTVPVALLAPALLAHPFGHLATGLPAFFIFMLLLAYTVYRKVGHESVAIAVSAIAVTLPGVYNPTSGVAPFWLDPTAAFLVGPAVLALLNSNGARDLRWLAGFALLGSFAAFARYVSFVYLAFVSAPILIGYVVSRVRQEGWSWHSGLLPLLVVGGGVAVISGPYLLGHVSSVAEFYRTYGYALGAPLSIASRATAASLREFLGAGGVLALVVLTGAWMVTTIRARSLDTAATVLALWLALAVPIFLIFVLKTSATHTVPYAVVLLLAAVVAVSGASSNSTGGSLRLGVVSVALLIAGVGWGGYYRSEWKQAASPSADAVEAKALQTELADQLVRYGPKVVWSAYFDEISWLPSLDAFYRHGQLPLPLGQDYVFSIHETVYQGNYPGWDRTRIHEALLKNANTWLNIAVVFENPGDAFKALPNEPSRNAARYISQSIKSDPRWVKVFEVNTVRYGRLVGYQNSRAKSENYRLLLAGKADLRPSDERKTRQSSQVLDDTSLSPEQLEGKSNLRESGRNAASVQVRKAAFGALWFNRYI